MLKPTQDPLIRMAVIKILSQIHLGFDVRAELILKALEKQGYHIGEVPAKKERRDEII